MPVWIEPTDSDIKPQYPYNRAKVTESGHSQEFDDTPGNERIRTQHRSGSFQEYQATGNVVHKIVGNGYTIIAKDNNVSISGACNITIYGNSNLDVKGDLYSTVGGKAKVNVKGDCELTSQSDVIVTADGVVNVNATEINLGASDAVYVDCDLSVRGDIIGQQSISAFGNLTAGGHLGCQGSLNIVGGIPQAGGPPLPHIITGMLGSYTNVVGPISMTSAAAILSTAGAAITSKAGAAVSITAGAAASLTAAGVVSVKAPTTSITSITSIKGVTSIVGAVAIKGATMITGACIATGDVRAGGGSTGLLTHIHPVPLGVSGPGKG